MVPQPLPELLLPLLLYQHYLGWGRSPVESQQGLECQEVDRQLEAAMVAVVVCSELVEAWASVAWEEDSQAVELGPRPQVGLTLLEAWAEPLRDHGL